MAHAAMMTRALKSRDCQGADMNRRISRPLWVGILGSSALYIAVVSIAVQAMSQSADTQEIVATTYHNTFTHAHPVLKRVRPGDTIRTKTLDASGRDDKGAVRGQPSNPLTGPFYVEGAEAGDTLAIRFTKVRLNRNWGYTAYRLGLFSLTPESIEGLYSSRGHQEFRSDCAVTAPGAVAASASLESSAPSIQQP